MPTAIPLAVEVRQGRAKLNSALLVIDRPDCQVISLDFATKVQVLGYGGREGSTDVEVHFEPVGKVADWSADAVTTVTVKGGAPNPERGVWLVEASSARYSAWIYRWIEPTEAPSLFEAQPQETKPAEAHGTRGPVIKHQADAYQEAQKLANAERKVVNVWRLTGKSNRTRGWLALFRPEVPAGSAELWADVWPEERASKREEG